MTPPPRPGADGRTDLEVVALTTVVVTVLAAAAAALFGPPRPWPSVAGLAAAGLVLVAVVAGRCGRTRLLRGVVVAAGAAGTVMVGVAFGLLVGRALPWLSMGV